MAALLELQAETRNGARLIACAESLAERLAGSVAEHDTAGTFAFENVALLKQASYFTAPIPTQFGGQGVDSVHDILVAASRLARGDAATTIGLNMHLLVVSNMVRRWRVAVARGHARRAEAFGRSLERIVDDEVVIAAAVSEPNQHLTQPSTRATRQYDGWLVNGRKIFCTMSPAAVVPSHSRMSVSRSPPCVAGFRWAVLAAISSVISLMDSSTRLRLLDWPKPRTSMPLCASPMDVSARPSRC